MKNQIKPPLRYYFWIIASAGVFIYSLIAADNYTGKIIVPLIINMVLYLILANHSCYIDIVGYEMVISYLPFNNKVQIPTEGIVEIAYLGGFFNPSEDKNPKNYYVPRVFYDTIKIRYKNSQEIEIFLNIRKSEIKILKKYLYAKLEK
jgi:hypothetical protein